MSKSSKRYKKRPCTKVAYTWREANSAAGRREAMTGVPTYVTLCFDGCGQVFHLTRRKPSASNAAKFERIGNPPKRQRSAAKRRAERQKAKLRPQICVWEGEGGSYGP
jgi:hypothetical protein